MREMTRMKAFAFMAAFSPSWRAVAIRVSTAYAFFAAVTARKAPATAVMAVAIATNILAGTDFTWKSAVNAFRTIPPFFTMVCAMASMTCGTKAVTALMSDGRAWLIPFAMDGTICLMTPEASRTVFVRLATNFCGEVAPVSSPPNETLSPATSFERRLN